MTIVQLWAGGVKRDGKKRGRDGDRVVGDGLGRLFGLEFLEKKESR